MLKNKDEAFECFKRFKATVEKEFEAKVRVLRTDRGGEFCSKAFLNYCENEEITRHFTTPYTPQQNGVVERRNRTVVAMTRSMLKQARMPSSFWGEAVCNAVYLLNKLPTRALSNKTPYEVLKREKPSVGHVRVFRCLAHVKVPSVYVGKLDDRSKAMVHLGREHGTKGYRLYDPEGKKICISGDVVFEENKTWDWSDQTNEVNDRMELFSVPGYGYTGLENNGEETENVQAQGAGTAVENSQWGEPNTPTTERRMADTSDETAPRKFRLVSDIYDETGEVELEEELMLMGVEEPTSYSQEVKEKEWRKAMEREIEAFEKK